MQQTKSNETPIKILSGAVKVKNANLIQVGKEGHNETIKYVLQHYDTIILEVVNGEVLIISKISVSSTRAISQALQYLKYTLSPKYANKAPREIIRMFETEGRFVKRSTD